MVMKIGIVQTEDALKTGQFRYSSQLIKYLKEVSESDEVVEHRLTQKEYNLGGRPVGGFVSLWFQKMFSNYSEEVVHALDPACAPRSSTVVTVHDLIPYKFPEIYQTSFRKKLGFNLNKKNTMKIPYFIVQTQHVKKDLMKLWDIDEERIFIVMSGIAHEIFYPSKNVPDCMKDDKKTILHVGNENPRKNLFQIVKSMKYLDDDVRLVWVGGSKFVNIRKKCEQIAKENDLDIVRAGYVPDEKLRDYYTHTDLLVRPSLDEGLGLTPIEAMACGTTSLVSNIPVFHEVLGDNVYYTDFDEKEIAENIRKSLENKKNSENLKNYAAKFRWGKAAKQTLQVYNEICR